MKWYLFLFVSQKRYCIHLLSIFLLVVISLVLLLQLLALYLQVLCSISYLRGPTFWNSAGQSPSFSFFRKASQAWLPNSTSSSFLIHKCMSAISLLETFFVLSIPQIYIKCHILPLLSVYVSPDITHSLLYNKGERICSYI